MLIGGQAKFLLGVFFKKLLGGKVKISEMWGGSKTFQVFSKKSRLWKKFFLKNVVAGTNWKHPLSKQRL